MVRAGPDKKPLLKWRTLSSSDTQAVAQMWSAHPGALPAIDLAKCGLFASPIRSCRRPVRL
jgi:hypothetical protein